MGFLSGIFKRGKVKKASVCPGEDRGCYISEDLKTGIFLEGSSEEVRGKVKNLLHKKLLSIGEEDAKGEIRRALEEINAELYSEGEEVSAIVFHQLEKYIALVHVGVSRAYIVRRDEMIQITEDDTQGWQLFKSGLIEEDKLRESPLGRMASKLLGRCSSVQLNTGEYYFTEEEKLVLIWGEKAMEYGDEKLWDIFGGSVDIDSEEFREGGCLLKTF